jgi:hypothetical protein
VCVYLLAASNAINYVLMAIVTHIDVSLNTKETFLCFSQLLAGITGNMVPVALVLGDLRAYLHLYRSDNKLLVRFEAIEFVGPSYRCLATSMIGCFYILGQYTALALGLTVKDYEQLYAYLGCLFTLLPLFYWYECSPTRKLILSFLFESI